MKTKLNIKETDVRIQTEKDGSVWFCLTDIAKAKSDGGDSSQIIQNWMRSKPTIEFLGLWEKLNGNENFKPLEFEGFRNEAGSNAFLLSPKKWVDGVNAIGIKSKSGRYGGTWARRQIALEFASWVDSAFKLYLITEFERLKFQEIDQLDWEIKRQITSDNHHIHSDAIRRNLVPPKQINKRGEGIFLASEVDMLNEIVFGMTSKQWRQQNADKPLKKNIRDYATKEELFLLNNLQAINAAYLEENLDQITRYQRLKGICGYQKELIKVRGLKILPGGNEK